MSVSTEASGSGLHFKLLTRVSAPANLNSSCYHHVVYALPDAVIVDRYELDQRNEEGHLCSASKQVHIYDNTSGNLERPLDLTLLNASVHLGLSWQKGPQGVASIVLPLHTRTIPAHDIERHAVIKFPQPKVFWTCPSAAPVADLPAWIRKLPHDLQQSTSVTRYVASAQSTQPILVHMVPIGQMSDLKFVLFFTQLCPWFGAAWLLYCTWRALRNLAASSTSKRHNSRQAMQSHTRS